MTGEYIPFNGRVTLIHSTERYSQIKWNRTIGWVDSSALGRDPPNTSWFTSSLNPVSLREEPSDSGRQVASLDINEPVEVITTVPSPTRDDLMLPLFWAKVRSPRGTGWIGTRNISQKQTDYYFLVSAYSGLNLREAPSLSSSVVKLMPFSTTGKIIRRNHEELVIDSRKGFWFQGEYEGRKGWVFSGYTLISSDLNSLQNGMAAMGEAAFRKFFETISEGVQMSEQEFQAVRNEFPHEETTETKYFEIHRLSAAPGDQCDQRVRNQLIFRNKKTGAYFHFSGGIEEFVQSSDTPLPESIQTTVSFCVCCCPWMESRTYFLMQDSVKMAAVSLGAPSNEDNGRCNFGPIMSGYAWGGGYRKISDTQLMGHLRFPNCDDVNPGKAVMTGGSFEPSGFKHELFIVLDYDPARNSVEVRKTYEQGVPGAFSAAWNQAASRP